MSLEDRLRAHVHALSGVRHAGTRPNHLNFARDFICTHLKSLGFEVELQEVTRCPVPQFNVLARRPGDSSLRRLVIEAHYDTVAGSPGADDNASGVAGMLEVARLTGCLRGVEFAAFCLEEDRLRGAACYVDQLAWQEQPSLIDLEMIGFALPPGSAQTLPLRIASHRIQIPLPGLGRCIAVVGNWASRDLTRGISRACMHESLTAVPFSLPGLGALVPDVRRSDHALFWKRGLPAVMVTDTANFRNPHYHRDSDLPDTLDYEFAARVTRGVARYVRGINASEG